MIPSLSRLETTHSTPNVVCLRSNQHNWIKNIFIPTVSYSLLTASTFIITTTKLPVVIPMYLVLTSIGFYSSRYIFFRS